MANQLGALGTAPREYDAHERHTNAAKRRKSGQRAEWLAVQATRLSSTSAVIAAKLLKYNEDQIEAASSLSAIP